MEVRADPAEGRAGGAADRIWTVPNALSLARLLGVPLFLWLVLAGHDTWALGLLVGAGLSDWLDGRLARALGQTSRLGALLDPAADRLYILATLVGLTMREIIPLWLTLLLVGREAAITPIVPVLRRLGYNGTLPVHMVGKAGTLCLLYAFPLLLLGDHSGAVATAARVFGWSFAIWGTALYWWAAVLYWVQVRQLVLADRTGAGPPGVPPGGSGADPRTSAG
ncbi:MULTISPECIES: CDP-alcohol phosphatidyltransferase family protein [Thermomonospora]|uniref:CDP-alcohol phosphatidyltransferase n=1 Tax=Thermomonospora curvata (strain ATCC 19995 / DSM 43183 / JCM 3096 / KCTC 9072 / NBRC 15933 / NCIMB 10081 / Henssen B9) TaxID=471852 RepID=D1A3U8_THECD|nr:MULTISPECIES: CDP-alcohol phosphatidyltransferase family protein [Thermomonospora]ACY98001.1 CDP-alcohol phosphatidyltransferase [Thermomonospora curvata DSM 43183]PKK14279.1 MAG: CDP-alcohol phosphatidyltransferase family protein [Thermomonospora sp. CIF 1]